MRYLFRDYFRSRRVKRHIARHGDVYDFHGIKVAVPLSAGIGAANALLRGKYERAEAALVSRHLPSDCPVIELGGSLGVVSALIRSQLGPGQRHIIVEANPDILEICRANAMRGAGPEDVDLIHAALFYDGAAAEFLLGTEVHSNALATGAGVGRRVTVSGITLQDLWTRLGKVDGFTLVSDIEGGEAGIFHNEPDILNHVGVMIMEMHPNAYSAIGTSQAELLEIARQRGLHEIDRIEDTVVLIRN